jgi:hypothetical protein
MNNEKIFNRHYNYERGKELIKINIFTRILYVFHTNISLVWKLFTRFIINTSNKIIIFYHLNTLKFNFI